ncbi:MAG TPA: TetR/AcrR family transcriptional regulator [Parvularculaceae bacterium]|nr:TetR/AcrR family transcriptional regulator [Parvularculaceae bacterium]
MSGSETGQASQAEAEIYSRQREKSEAMRCRVCEAATACLAAAGYHGTSIGKIAARAGVSQGALQHHYPSKEDLVAGVLDFLLTRSVAWFAVARVDLARDKDAFGEVVRRSWREQFCSDDYAAILEILTAARTDEALQERTTPALARWRELIDAELAELLPATDQTADELRTILTISRAMMTGLLVHDRLLGNEAHIARVIDKWIEIARL